jgi:hypothetical protein
VQQWSRLKKQNEQKFLAGGRDHKFEKNAGKLGFLREHLGGWLVRWHRSIAAHATRSMACGFIAR